MSTNEKTVDEKTFKECCDLMLAGRMHPDVAAYLTGLSRPTFRKRVNQFYDPERYGPLPDNFFDGRKDVWKENTGWIKESSSIKRYLAKQEEKKEQLRRARKERRDEKKKNTFLDASELPKL